MNDPAHINVLAGLLWAGSLVFMLLYAVEPWWRSWFGRSLMTMAVGMFIFASMALLQIRLGSEYPFRGTLRLIGYALLTVAMWSRVYVLWRARRADRSHTPVDH